MLYNVLKAINKLPKGNSGKVLSDFADRGNIAAYAQEAMDYLVKTGTVSDNDGKLAPMETTTRAQLAQVLYNIIEKQ